MRTSRLYNQLQTLLGQSIPWADRRHLQTLIWMVVGVICAECISLPRWSIYSHTRAVFAQSHQRRFSRWLHNSRINVHKLYSPLIQTALADWESSTITVIEDTSLLWNEYCLIRLSVQYRGRAVPLVWRVIRHRSSSVQFCVYQAMLNLAIGRDPISKQQWLVATNEPATLQTFREYAARFAIEEEFLDEKSNGFQLERSEVRSVIALSRLCFVLAVATLVLTVQGQQVVASGKRRWVDCHWQRGNSYLRIGWSWIKGTFHQTWGLFPTLALQGQLDPDPAFASNKQVQSQLEREFRVKSYNFAP